MPVPDFSPGEVLTAAAMDSIGLWKIASGTLSGAAVNFVGCFTDNYDNYLIKLDRVGVSATADIYYRMLEGTTPFTSSYVFAFTGLTAAGATSNAINTGSSTFGYTGISFTSVGSPIGSATLEVFGTRQNNARTQILGNAFSFQSQWYSRVGGGQADDNRLFDGIEFSTASTPTMQGNVTIYGYRK
jgi:hypothetical protein